jgi:signal transduction histidine kinase
MAELQDALAGRLADTGGTLSIGPMPVVRGHPSLLSLLFQNLLANALKFHPADRRPEVLVHAQLAPGVARISVSDNGIGIAPEHRPLLFQPFQRLHRRNEYEGTGLGLALARQIAEAHGGSIGVDSLPGQGATFTVTLPLAEAGAAGTTTS